MTFPPNRRLSCALLLAVIAGYFLPQQLHSQASGLSPHRLSYAILTPGLPVLPELHTDMTLEAFIGYVYLDSIARTVGIETAITSPENMSIPELRAFSRYVYGMGDYNPVLLLRHFTSTADSSFPNSRYASYPANTYFNFLLAVDRHRDDFGRAYSLLVMSSYVLHVRVTDVISGTDTTFGGQRPWTNVACEVIETFKGKVRPDNCTPPSKIESVSASSDCITYGFPHNEDRIAPKVGDEFIIFLYLQPITLQEAILYPMFGQEPGNGVFRIMNGQVQDTGNTWGLGTTPSLTDFRNKIRNNIDQIKNWTW